MFEGHSPLPPEGSPEYDRRRAVNDALRQVDPDHLFCPTCLCCSADWEECEACGGEGYEDRYDEDPLWYGHHLWRCGHCGGEGRFLVCLGACWKAPTSDVTADYAMDPRD